MGIRDNQKWLSLFLCAQVALEYSEGEEFKVLRSLSYKAQQITPDQLGVSFRNPPENFNINLTFSVLYNQTIVISLTYQTKRNYYEKSKQKNISTFILINNCGWCINTFHSR